MCGTRIPVMDFLEPSLAVWGDSPYSRRHGALLMVVGSIWLSRDGLDAFGIENRCDGMQDSRKPHAGEYRFFTHAFIPQHFFV